MSAPREVLFERLFAKIEGLVAPVGGDLSTVTPLRVASRVLRSWDDCPPGQCPAGFLTAAGESRQTRPGFPAIVTIRAELVVYVKNDQGRGTVPSTLLNALISAVEDVLKRQPTDGPSPTALFPTIQSWGTTLGGLCYTCGISDGLQIYEGFEGVDSLAAIPLYMVTTDA